MFDKLTKVEAKNLYEILDSATETTANMKGAGYRALCNELNWLTVMVMADKLSF